MFPSTGGQILFPRVQEHIKTNHKLDLANAPFNGKLYTLELEVLTFLSFPRIYH